MYQQRDSNHSATLLNESFCFKLFPDLGEQADQTNVFNYIYTFRIPHSLTKHNIFVQKRSMTLHLAVLICKEKGLKLN